MLAVPALLALTACGDERRDPPSAPLGYELAAAGATATARSGATDGDAKSVPAVPVGSPLSDLSPQQLAARLVAGNVRLIDVRTDAEIAEGVIAGAEHIPLDRFDPATLDLSDGREVVLYCRSGRRSAIAGAKLAAVTGKPVEQLAGGILAWEAAKQPISAR